MLNVYAEPLTSFQQVGGDCPSGWVVMSGERPSIHHIATEGGDWILPEIDFKELVTARRYQVEVGGISVNGHHVDTDDRSKLLINGAAVEAMIDPDYQLQWKTNGGFIVLTGEQVLYLARAIRAHVQACFNREAELLQHIDDDTFEVNMLDEGWPS